MKNIFPKIHNKLKLFLRWLANIIIIFILFLICLLAVLFFRFKQVNSLPVVQNNKSLQPTPTISTEKGKEPPKSQTQPEKNLVYDNKPIPIITPKLMATPKVMPTTEAWGVATQIDEVTWTMKVGQDERIATPQEIFEALNAYRVNYGKGRLVWDNNLATFANERAVTFNQIKNTDKHAGFKACAENEECINKLNHNYLGENSCYGYKLLGVHLIEWIFAADEGHNNNQLSSDWIYVGIGVQGLGVDIIFGV
ncbi:MAG: CAP domain-containing protein [Candidatus Shapirobacteria bacterium]|nr:CAP domain-containing protein [Candidatus Shapirobacteria bacterium]